MDSFYISLYVPSIDKKLKFKEINNFNLFTILKFIVNKDLKGLGDYFEFLLSENLLDKEYSNSLNMFDKFIIMLQYKAVNINQELKFVVKTEDKKESTLSFNLFNILKDLTEKTFLSNDEIEISENVFLGLSIPKKLYSENFDDSFNDIITYVRSADEKIFLNKLTQVERDNLLNSITGDNLTKIISFLNKVNDSTKEVSLLKENTHLKDLNNLKLNFFDNSLIKFLELIYFENLLNFFEFMYVMINKVKLSMSEFYSLVPSESLIMYNFFKKDIDEQNKEIEEMSKKGKGPTIAK
jgi:hypothetical protein